MKKTRTTATRKSPSRKPPEARQAGTAPALNTVSHGFDSGFRELKNTFSQLEVGARGLVGLIESALDSARESVKVDLATSLLESGALGLALEVSAADAAPETQASRDLSHALLSWAESALGMQSRGSVGQVLDCPVERLDQLELPANWEPPAAGLVRIRIRRPEWRRGSKTLRKAVVEVLD